MFVACLGGQVVGWLHVHAAHRLESAPFAEICGFVVDASWRRRGLGRLLLATAEQWATDCGMARIRVRVRSDRNEARMVYGRQGFALEKAQVVFGKLLPAALPPAGTEAPDCIFGPRGAQD